MVKLKNKTVRKLNKKNKKNKNLTKKIGIKKGGEFLSICAIGLLMNSIIHAIGINAVFHSTLFDIFSTTGNIFTNISLLIIALDDITNEIIIKIDTDKQHTNDKIIELINDKMTNKNFKTKFIENIDNDSDKNYLQKEWDNIINFITKPDSKVIGLQSVSALGFNISGIIFGIQTAMSKKINNILRYKNSSQKIDLSKFLGIQRVAHIKKSTGLNELSDEIEQIIKSEIENFEKRIHKKLFENHNENDKDTKCIINDTVKEQMNILSIQISTRIFTIFENMNANINRYQNYDTFIKIFESKLKKEFEIIFKELYPKNIL